MRVTVTPAGRAEQAVVARAFVDGVLGLGHPCGRDAALLVIRVGPQFDQRRFGGTLTCIFMSGR